MTSLTTRSSCHSETQIYKFNVFSPCCPLSPSRTDALLLRLSLLVGQQVFYGALWGSMLVTPMVRLPASVFIVTHFDSLRQLKHMLGYDHRMVVSVCVSVTAQMWYMHYLMIMGIYLVFLSCFSLVHLSDLLTFCLFSDKVGVSFSARLKCPGTEEHAGNPALLFPLCYMPGR